MSTDKIAVNAEPTACNPAGTGPASIGFVDDVGHPWPCTLIRNTRNINGDYGINTRKIRSRDQFELRWDYLPDRVRIY